MKIFILGIASLAAYIFLLFVIILIDGNYFTNILYALIGGTIVSILASMISFTNKVNGKDVVIHSLLAHASSILFSVISIILITITPMKIYGSAAIVVNITVGTFGALVYYANQFQNINQENIRRKLSSTPEKLLNKEQK